MLETPTEKSESTSIEGAPIPTHVGQSDISGVCWHETHEEIGKVRIVHDMRTQLRRQSHNALVGPIVLLRPGGWVSASGISGGALVRVAHEHRLCWAQFEIHPSTDLIHVCRTGKDPTKLKKVGGEHFRADDTSLVEAFKTPKEEDAVLSNWASP